MGEIQECNFLEKKVKTTEKKLMSRLSSSVWNEIHTKTPNQKSRIKIQIIFLISHENIQK